MKRISATPSKCRWTMPHSFYPPLSFFKYAKIHPLLFMLFLLLSLCKTTSQELLISPGSAPACIQDFNANTDYFPFKLPQFNYFKSYKTITANNETLVLYYCGSPRPNVPNAKYFKVPVTSVAVMDTTSVTFLEVLGKRYSIDYTSSEELITSPCIQELNQSNHTEAVVSLNLGNETMAKQQLEKTDVIFEYMDPLSGSLGNSVNFSATATPDNIEKIEWLNYVAAFFNLEESSSKLTTQMKENYKCLSASAVKAAETNKVVLAWTLYTAPADFNNNTASWTISAAQFKLDFTENVGATSLSKETRVFTNGDEFRKALASVDVLIDETFASVTKEDFFRTYGLTSSSDFKFIKNSRVWQENKQLNSLGGSPWFESAVAFPHVVLADLISAVHPSLLSNYQTTYLRNIFSQPDQVLLKGSNCTSVSASLPVPIIDCPAANTQKTSFALGRFEGLALGLGISLGWFILL